MNGNYGTLSIYHFHLFDFVNKLPCLPVSVCLKEMYNGLVTKLNLKTTVQG